MSDSHDAPDHGSRESASADESIPMLTEIVRSSADRAASDERDVLPQSIEQVDWPGLAERVRSDVLARLMQHSDAQLAGELRGTLAVVLDRALERLGDEMHDALSQLVRELVARAVADEITRLHDEIAQRDRDATAG